MLCDANKVALALLLPELFESTLINASSQLSHCSHHWHLHYSDATLPTPPSAKKEKNVEETGCKIYLPILAFSKQMSQNYVGTVILGKNLPQIKLKAVCIRMTCVSYLFITICNYFLEWAYMTSYFST